MERAYLPSTTLGEDVYPLAGLHLLKNVQEGDVVDAAASEETGDEGVLVAVLLAAGAPADVLQLVEAN